MNFFQKDEIKENEAKRSSIILSFFSACGSQSNSEKKIIAADQKSSSDPNPKESKGIFNSKLISKLKYSFKKFNNPDDYQKYMNSALKYRKEVWMNRLDFICSTLGYIVGLGAVWRL